MKTEFKVECPLRSTAGRQGLILSTGSHLSTVKPTPHSRCAAGGPARLGQEQPLQAEPCHAGLHLSWATCTRRKEASYNHWLTPAALVSLSLDNEGQERFVTFSSLPPVMLDDRLSSDSSVIISEPAGGVTALTGSAGASAAALGDSELSRLCLYPPSSSRLTNQSAHADDVLPGTRAHAAAGDVPRTLSASAECSWVSVTPLRACCTPSSWAWKCCPPRCPRWPAP